MNILYVNWQYAGVSDGSAEKPFKTIGEAIEAMTDSIGGYALHVAPGVYCEKTALETPATGLIIHGNGSTLIATGGITVKGRLCYYEFTITGTVTVDGGSVDVTLEVTQALLDATIADIKTRFAEGVGNGVYIGLEVAQQTVADMTVKVSAGTIYMADGTRYEIAAKASQAITAADATNPRKDIVYVSSAGVITYLAGTPAASPSAPAVPTGGLNLAEIAVAANATTVVTGNITDKRTMLNA